MESKETRNHKINKSIMKKTIDEYTDDFTSRLNDYVESYIKENNLKYIDIYKATGIPKSSFTNYQTDRLPKYTETLIFLKDYFNIPFSYLFKETDTKNLDNIDIGLAYGLNDASIKKLKSLKEKSNNDTLDNNYENTIKLFFINSIINNDDILYAFSVLIPFLIGRNKCENKFKGEKIRVPFGIDEDYIDYLKYSAYEQYVDYLNRLTSNDMLPSSLVNYSFKIIEKKSNGKTKQVRF